ncbi:MAG: hypothetical protein ACRDVW_01730, partial [Acidimicrobiales bacterium]
MPSDRATTNKATIRRFYEAVDTRESKLISKMIDELTEPDVLLRQRLPIEATGAETLIEKTVRGHPDQKAHLPVK